jgi:hypothetical protein
MKRMGEESRNFCQPSQNNLERKTKSSRIYLSKSYIIRDIMTQMAQPIISCISPCRSACASEEAKNWEKTKADRKRRERSDGLPRELCCRSCSARSTHAPAPAPAPARSGPTFLPVTLRSYPNNGLKELRGGR